MQKEWLNLKNFFQCTSICHECRAHKSTYMVRNLNAERYTLQEFFNEGLKPGPVCPLLLVPHFQISMIRWCAMHVLHLGCDLWIVGNSLKTLLLDTHVWGDGCDDDRLLNGWLEFKEWARKNKWQHSMGKFSTKSITSRQHPYPELQSKAWNARVCVAWMADFLQDLSEDHQFPDLPMMRQCVKSMAAFHQTSEENGRYLSPEIADLMQHQTDNCIEAYIKLAFGAIEADRLMWPARPKWHGMQEMVARQRLERINCRKFHSFATEDLIGRVKQCCAASKQQNLELMATLRWYTGLTNKGQTLQFAEY